MNIVVLSIPIIVAIIVVHHSKTYESELIKLFALNRQWAAYWFIIYFTNRNYLQQMYKKKCLEYSPVYAPGVFIFLNWIIDSNLSIICNYRLDIKKYPTRVKERHTQQKVH